MLPQEKTAQQKADLDFARYFDNNFTNLSDQMVYVLVKGIMRTFDKPENIKELVDAELAHKNEIKFDGKERAAA